LPKITGDSRCASKGIHWCQIPSNCFPNMKYSLHCTEMALDNGTTERAKTPVPMAHKR